MSLTCNGVIYSHEEMDVITDKEDLLCEVDKIVGKKESGKPNVEITKQFKVKWKNYSELVTFFYLKYDIFVM